MEIRVGEKCYKNAWLIQGQFTKAVVCIEGVLGAVVMCQASWAVS